MVAMLTARISRSSGYSWIAVYRVLSSLVSAGRGGESVDILFAV